MKLLSYAETTEVEIEGGRFTLGTIPAQKWTEIRLNARRNWLAAQRRALLALAASGETFPSEEAREERVHEEIGSDPEYRAVYERLIRETVAWGVVGHVWEGGPAFETTERTYFGRTYKGASDQTVADYADTVLDSGGRFGRLVEALYLAVSDKATVKGDAKKNSPPPVS